MATTYQGSLADVLKKKRREWFLTAWKPQGICLGCTERDCDKCGRHGVKYKGSSCYDDVRIQLEKFSSEHQNTKWAYSIHEKGHTLETHDHSHCEHKHIVIVTENPCSGKSISKYFGGAWIEPARYGVGHCARYLLHLTTSSLSKERISASDLYCSGRGEHGQIWFDITTPVIYDTFNKDNTLHYVFNEGMTSLFRFMQRFGAGTVGQGVNLQVINTVLGLYARHEVDIEYCKEIFEMLDRDKQKFIARDVCSYPFDKAEFMTSDEIVSDPFFLKSPVAYKFQRLFIWLHNFSGVASAELVQIMRDYDLVELLKVNEERENLFKVIQDNSFFLDENKSE